jgi:hypothetical protein
MTGAHAAACDEPTDILFDPALIRPDTGRRSTSVQMPLRRIAP